MQGNRTKLIVKAKNYINCFTNYTNVDTFNNDVIVLSRIDSVVSINKMNLIEVVLSDKS